jgi:hypothetical protein
VRCQGEWKPTEPPWWWSWAPGWPVAAACHRPIRQCHAHRRAARLMASVCQTAAGMRRDEKAHSPVSFYLRGNTA